MKDSTRQLVLVVEDADALRSAIRLNLVKRGRSVREAATLSAARSAFSEERPDFLILDLNLPDGSGQDLLREMHTQNVVVPTVLISAAPVTTLQLADSQSVWYLPKPFRIEALLNLVQLASARGLNLEERGDGGGPASADSESGGAVRSDSFELLDWVRELRCACITLSRASTRSIRSMTLSLRVTVSDGEPLPTAIATRMASEYGLTCWAELDDGVLRIRLRRDDGFPFRRTSDGDERGSAMEMMPGKSRTANSVENPPTR